MQKTQENAEFLKKQMKDYLELSAEKRKRDKEQPDIEGDMGYPQIS